MTERFREPMLAQIDLQDLLNNVPYSNDIDVKIPKAADIPRVLTNNGNPHLVKLSNMYRMHCASVLLYIQNGKIQQLNNFEAKFYKSFHFGECQHLCNDNAAVGRIMNHWELALNEAIIKSIYPQYSSIIPEDVLQLWNDQYFQRSSNNIYQLLGDLPLELRQQKRTNYDQLRQIFQTRQHLARYARNASISLLENHGKMTKFWNSLDLDSFVRMSRIENDCGRQRRLQWIHNVTNMLGEDINLEQWSVWLSNIIKEIVPLYFNQSLECENISSRRKDLEELWKHNYNIFFKFINQYCEEPTVANSFRAIGLYLDNLFEILVDKYVQQIQDVRTA